MGKIAEKTKRKKLNFVEKNVIQTGLLITFENVQDDVQSEEPEGMIYNVHIPYGISYRGYGDLFMKMERIYNLLDRPQAEFEMRNLKKTNWKGTVLENTDRWNFEDSCFEDFKKLYISSKRWAYAETLFRRHGSWQGVMKTTKTGSLYYRSDLELMHYIAEYLRETRKKR